MDYYALGHAIVLNDEEQILGIITDGIIRRALLKGASLETKVGSSLSKDYFSLPIEREQESVHHFNHLIKFIPIVDSNGAVKNVYPNDNLQSTPKESEQGSRQFKQLFHWVNRRSDPYVYLREVQRGIQKTMSNERF